MFCLSATSLSLQSCSSNEETDSSSKLLTFNEAKAEIIRLADEYGLDMTVDDAGLTKKIGTITQSEIEEEMKAISEIRGTYTKVVGDSTSFTMSTAHTNSPMKMSRSTEVELPAKGGFNAYGTISKYSRHYSVCIPVSWSCTPSKYSVSLGEATIDVSSKHFQTNPTLENYMFVGNMTSFTFYGSLKFNNGYTDITFKFDGGYSVGLCSLILS